MTKEPEEVREWAAQCQRLKGDEVLQQVLATVRHRQHKTFENRNASEKEIMDAHFCICAIKEIVAEIDRGIKAGIAIENKQ